MVPLPFLLVHSAFAFSKCNNQQSTVFAIGNHQRQKHHHHHPNRSRHQPLLSQFSIPTTTTMYRNSHHRSPPARSTTARTNTAAMASSLSSFDLVVVSSSSFAEFDSLAQTTTTAIMAVDPTTTIVASASAVTTTTTFEPVLNVPALIIFLVITLVFGFLQFRVAAIGNAVDRRTQALHRLRSIKAKQLSGAFLQDDDDNVLIVQEATEEYRQAVEEVESLRTIIPGLARIAPPPAPTAIMEENVAAAKQFLGIDLESRSLLADEKKQQNQQNQQQQQKSLSSPILIAVLVAVAISQIGLLFLLSLDPMMPSSNVLP